MKRALAYIGGPRQLKDFIWYYLAYGTEYTWDLVCQPMVKEMKLEDICRKTGLFANIFVPDSFFYQPKGKLVRIGLKMTAYWLLGQNKRYAQKEINKMTDMDQYDHLCLSTTRGVTCGLMALCADNMTIDLLEDGLGDDTDSHAKFDIRRIKEKNYLVSYAFAKMGYFNAYGRFPLKSMKKCVRFSEQPDNLSRELYKSVRVLNDMSLIDKNRYMSLVDKAFGFAEISADIKAVLFTAPLIDLTENYNYCIMQTLSYLKKQGYKKILLKKHPRDFTDYEHVGIEFEEVNALIPAEEIIEKIINQKMVFMFPSTAINTTLKKKLNVVILKYKCLGSVPSYRSLFSEAVDALDIIQSDFAQIIEI